MLLFGAEHCSPSDVLIGLPWGPCPSPPAGENHPPPPRGRITAVEGQPASLGCTSACPPRASHQMPRAQFLNDPSTAPLTLARHCPPGTTSFPSLLAHGHLRYPKSQTALEHSLVKPHPLPTLLCPPLTLYDSRALQQYLWCRPVLLAFCPLPQVTILHFRPVTLSRWGALPIPPPPVFLSLCVSPEQTFPFLPSCKDSPLSSLCGLTGPPSPQPVVITPTLGVSSGQKLS